MAAGAGRTDFRVNTPFGTPGGTRQLTPMAPSELDNTAILNVTMEELSDEDKAVIEQAVEQLKQKCLMSFGRVRGKVMQKTPLPRILMPSETDARDETDKQALFDAIHKMVHDAIGNHNRTFLTTFSNIMKSTFAGFPHEKFGPAYFNQQMA